jgi:hypothetical protein
MNPVGEIMGKLAGKVAVITGGNSGIGLATAQRSVVEGAYVFITGRRQAGLDAAVKQIGKNVTGVQGDVANLAGLDRLYAVMKEQKGRIDHPRPQWLGADRRREAAIQGWSHGLYPDGLPRNPG